MTSIERLEAALRAPARAGRPALVAYLTAGWPDRSGFASLLRDVSSVVDAVEIGVPFSDPMADGPTIQRTQREALEGGVTLDWILEMLTEMDPRPDAPLLLMGYLNPFLALGLESLANRAAAAGVSGFVVPDLPLEESGPLRSAVEAEGMGLVNLVTPVTEPGRLDTLCAESRGFVYAVTVTGITGGEAAIAPGLRTALSAMRSAAPVPVLAGFGIRHADQVRALAGTADGVIVGTALLDCISTGDDPVAFLRSLLSPATAASASSLEVSP